METAHAHIRAVGNGAIVEAIFDAVSAKPQIVAVATAQDNRFNVTPATAQRTVTLRQHQQAWIEHAKAIGDNDVGSSVMWLVAAQPNADCVTVREIITVLECAAHLKDVQVGILMSAACRDAFVQHWRDVDNGSINWSQVHIFTTVIGLHAFVASLGECIKHVCMVSGAADGVVQDMHVHDNTRLHAVVHDGSFVFQVPENRPMAMVQDDMPMLATENCTAFVQSRGSACTNTTIEIRRLPDSKGVVRLLYVSKFCDNNGLSHPVQWLRNFVNNNDATDCMMQDNLLMSLVLRAAASHCSIVPHRQPQQSREMSGLPSVVSPHLHRSITQQNPMY